MQKMNLSKFAFVILHYLTIIDTIDCVSSIQQKCKGNDYRIIIVDNGSNNGSYEQLISKYENGEKIHVIQTQSNLGYAKGNNFGIRFARQEFNPDFVIVMNNDILVLQEDMLNFILEEYHKSEFAVLGPMIYTADGRCNDNPGRSTIMNREEVIQVIKKSRQNVKLYRYHLVLFNRAYQFIARKWKKRALDSSQTNCNCYLERVEDIQLHGCFLVFSKTFFEQLDGFHPDTFLYMEEEILFLQLMQNGLKSVYNPIIKVYHKEDSASNALWGTDYIRASKKAMYILESAKVLLQILEDKS